MNFYLISFDTAALKMNAKIIEGPVVHEDIYYELCRILECDSLEFVDYSNEIVMIIDETGKLKNNNPIFRLKTFDGFSLDLAGKILFARNIENEFSTDIASIRYEDILYLRSNLEIKLIGIINPQ